jgi:hypothetical protein
MAATIITKVRPAHWPEKEDVPGPYPVPGGTLWVTDRFTTEFEREEGE